MRRHEAGRAMARLVDAEGAEDGDSGVSRPTEAEPGFLSCRAMWTRRSRGAAKEGRDGRRSATSTERVGNGIQSGRQRDMPAADEGPGPAASPEPCCRRSMTAGRSGRGRDRRGRPPSNLRSAGAERSRRSHERRQIAHVLPASRPSSPPPWKPCIHGHAIVDHNWHCAACWSQPRQCTRLQPISRRKRTKG